MKIRATGMALTAGLLLVACGGGDEAGVTTDLAVVASQSINTTTSHDRQTRGIEAGLDVNPFDYHQTGGEFLLAWTLMDLTGNDELDLVMAPGVPPFGDNGDWQNPVTTPFTTWRNTGSVFNLEDLLGLDGPHGIHPRKAVAMDFSGNGRDDLVVFDHGYDQPPFPGGPVFYVQTVDNGAGLEFNQVTLPGTGFFHCGAAGDIDNDGDIDILVGGMEPYFLVNDGDGNFKRVDNRLAGLGPQVFTCELVDVDGDGFLDIVVGGHEFENMPTAVFWGDSTGTWTGARRTVLDPVPGWGVITDIDAADVDGSGRRDLIVTRTGGTGPDIATDPTFYEGVYIQLLMQGDSRNFTDQTEDRIDRFTGMAPGYPCTSGGTWIDWMVAVDDTGNDAIDIRPLNPACGLLWENDGNGDFTLTGVNAGPF